MAKSYLRRCYAGRRSSTLLIIAAGEKRRAEPLPHRPG